MTVLISFFAALKAGDAWARVVVVLAILIGLAVASFAMVHRIASDAVEKERARIERMERGRADAAKVELDRVLGGDRRRVSGFDRD